MKKLKIAYYVSTGLVSMALAFSCSMYLTVPEIKQAFEHLGFPDYFRVELGIAKGLAAIALWIPKPFIKQIAYIGLGINLISAVIAHISVGDAIGDTLSPVFLLLLVLTSFYFNYKLETSK